MAPEDAWIGSELAIGLPHPRPFAPLHLVIAPTRHVAAFYDLDVQEQGAIWVLIGAIKDRLDVLDVDIGFEDGRSEEDHALVHVLPRIPAQPVKLPPGIDWVTV